jgi:hypothetical protein
VSKKRRRGGGGSRSRVRSPLVELPAAAETEKRPKKSDGSQRVGWLSRPPDPRWPSIPRSLGRGFLAVGSSPLMLAISFLFVFLAWVGLVGLGFEGPSGRLVTLAALPPVGSYFDWLIGLTVFGYGLPGLLAITGFLLVRSLLVAVMTGLVVQSLEGGASGLEGVVRGLRAYPVALAAGFLSLSMLMAGTVLLPVLGGELAFLGSVLILIAALFSLVFAPVAAVREQHGIVETLRRSGRAAMMPGSRHGIMSTLYILVAFPLLVLFAPSGNELTVNPGLMEWIYGLLATFVHLGFLAAFAYRWMAIESEVPDRPVKRPAAKARRA